MSISCLNNQIYTPYTPYTPIIYLDELYSKMYMLGKVGV